MGWATTKIVCFQLSKCKKCICQSAQNEAVERKKLRNLLFAISRESTIYAHAYLLQSDGFRHSGESLLHTAEFCEPNNNTKKPNATNSTNRQWVGWQLASQTKHRLSCVRYIYLLHLRNITSKDCTGSDGIWQPIFANRKWWSNRKASLNCLNAQKPHRNNHIRDFVLFFVVVNGRAPVSWSLGEMDLQISFISFSHLCASPPPPALMLFLRSG